MILILLESAIEPVQNDMNMIRPSNEVVINSFVAWAKLVFITFDNEIIRG